MFQPMASTSSSAERVSDRQCLHMVLSSRSSIKHHAQRKTLEELAQACGGAGSCKVELGTLRINAKQCLHMQSEISKLSQLVLPQDQDPAAQEFFRIAMRFVNIVEECSTEKWLLKAIEMGDCPEHFVELHLDLFWWCSQFLNSLRSLCRLSLKRLVQGEEYRYNESSMTTVRESREEDRQNLFDEVKKVEKERNRSIKGCHVDDLELASILNGRNPQCQAADVPSQPPPTLERYVKSWTFKFRVSFFEQVQGGTSFVVRFPWVYEKEFVLKMALKPCEEADVIKKEAEIMNKCRHPYTVAVVGCWEINSKSLMMMESMKCTLRELMNRSPSSSTGGGFSPSKVIDLMLPVAKAMRYLHGKEKPIAHRDIKPENIMCLGDSSIEDITKLIDFGDSMELGTVKKIEPAGTFGYMAPEVRNCRSLKHCDTEHCDLLKADVYSFGMVFWELLTWKSPIEALCDQAGKSVLSRNEVNELLDQGKRPHVPDHVPVYVAFIVESCWRKSPIIRPAFEDICLMLQNAQFLLQKGFVSSETFLNDKVVAGEALSMVSYIDGEGTEWPISGKFTLRDMLLTEEETR